MSQVPREEPGKRWETSVIVTLTICGLASAIGGLMGVLLNSSGTGSVGSKVFTGLVQGVGSAAIFGIAALIVVSVASLVWSVASARFKRQD